MPTIQKFIHLLNDLGTDDDQRLMVFIEPTIYHKHVGSAWALFCLCIKTERTHVISSSFTMNLRCFLLVMLILYSMEQVRIV